MLHRGIAFVVCLNAVLAYGQRNHITTAIENNRRVRLMGDLHPRAQAGTDLGPMDANQTLPSMMLILRQSPAQQQDLDQLLAAQQDPKSPEYHHWLTPGEYADRFGVSQTDIAKLTAWLEQQNLHVTGVARARNQIMFSGRASDVAAAFRTELHRYDVNGRQHFANATDPSIPIALEPVIRGIHGLSDFRLEPRSFQWHGSALPQYTSSGGAHSLGPADVATIYNIKPLHDAGFNGSGQTIVVAGQTRIDLADLQKYRARFGLPAADPETLLVPNTRDPGMVSSELGEADLDLEWAGAVAPNARLLYVYSYDVMDAVQYAIDQNLAPVISVSYGMCEPLTPLSEALAMQSWARQANAQGITWINASGDSGGADCVYGKSTTGAGFAVDLPAGIPEVTGVGGTTLYEGGGAYWNATNDANGGSALTYIPETTWNDSVPQDPAAGGGGASTIFLKPSWQTGAGVPGDGARDVPDVALASSAHHDGYIVYSGGSTAVYGGTSAATPVFAGIATLLNQYLVSTGAQAAPGLGNMNPVLYSLAQTAPKAFHDVVSGNNIVTVTCSGRSRNCTSGSYGFNAGPGYDQATGLGSVDAFELAAAWRGRSGSFDQPAASITLSASASTVASGGSVTISAVVKSSSGNPTGTVTFSLGAVPLGSATLDGSGVATLTIAASQLQPGANTITAQFNGDAVSPVASASAIVTLTVDSRSPSIASLTNGASFRQAFAPGMILSVFGSALAPTAAAAASVPLPLQLAGVTASINGIAAPLYYVSPSQINLQIPYETRVNGTAILIINNNGQTAASTLWVSSAAPGIFTDGRGFVVPTSSAARGSIVTLYITGEGAVSPALPTGAAPRISTPVQQLPVPVQAASVSIGGINASIQWIGIPPGLAGVTQVNVSVPLTAPAGNNAVIVNIGDGTSTAATLSVTP